MDDSTAAYYAEKANQYRFYVGLAEQKAVVIFTAMSALVAVNGSRLSPGTWNTVTYWSLAATCAALFGAYVSGSVAIELPWIRKVREIQDVHHRLRFRPLRHEDLLYARILSSDLIDPAQRGQDYRDDLQQLGILLEQRQNVLKLASRVSAVAVGLSLLAFFFSLVAS